MPKKNWYTIQASADAVSAEISIFDAIGATWDGSGVTARQFIADLKALKAKKITMLVNSPGGSLFDGVAIYNAIRSLDAEVTAKVLGVAASAASVIVMAAKKVVMPKASMLMVHKSATASWGNADDLRAMADTLDKIDNSLATVYADRTGKSVEEVMALLGDETWMSADEAVAMGFADEIADDALVEASFDLEALPERVRAALAPRQPEPTPTPAAAPALADQVRALADAEGVGAYAAVIALDPDVSNLDAARTVIARIREVKAYAEIAGKPELADQFIQARKSVADVRAELIKVQADEAAQTVVDNTPPTKPTASAKDSFSPTALWNEIKAMKAGSMK